MTELPLSSSLPPSPPTPFSPSRLPLPSSSEQRVDTLQQTLSVLKQFVQDLKELDQKPTETPGQWRTHKNTLSYLSYPHQKTLCGLLSYQFCNLAPTTMLPTLHTLCIVGAHYAFSGEVGGGEGTTLPTTREETTSERKMRFQEVCVSIH